jgi:iron complex outermembrane receptor protein
MYPTLAEDGIFVRDAETNTALPGAAATQNQEVVAVSDDQGWIDAQLLQSPAELEISHVGYKKKKIYWQDTVGTLYVTLEPDYQILEGLTVTGHENQRNLTEIAGSYSVLPAADLQRFNNESLVRAVNTLPGVRFEERSPSSYRVSIRGNLLRSPYGVRNVKVYWNDMPFTDPTGTTPLNLLDLNNIDKVEIIRGPAGSVYGAGMGGVLNLHSGAGTVQPVSADVGLYAGSFGYRKLTGNVRFGGQNHRFALRYANQSVGGYRDHTRTNRSVAHVQGKVFASDKQTLSLHMLYSDLFYQTPGGLTLQQYIEDPTQARPASQAQNASLDQQYLFVGISQDYHFTESFGNITSVYLTDGTKENPFITNWELERLKGYGGRTKFYYNTVLGTVPARFSLGGEVQYGDFDANNHGNNAGVADTLRYQDALQSINAFGFGQVELDLPNQWLCTVGASINSLKYDIQRLRDAALDTSYSLTRVFTPVISPRFGVVKKFSPAASMHGSISLGFSPPTTEEVRTSDGGINDKLEAEKGINYEIGIRGNLLQGKIMYDVTVFYLNQRETIVSRTDEAGTVLFENAGATEQTGIEALVSYAIVDDPDATISLLRLRGAYTWHHFRFSDYIKSSGGENVDYSGNALTGTAPHIFVTTVDMHFRNGLYTDLTINHTERIPLNDANTVYADAYQLVTVRAGFRTRIGRGTVVDLFAGVDNLLNQKYSLGNDLNAFGNRYYNPSPERNYFAGIQFNFNKN